MSGGQAGELAPKPTPAPAPSSFPVPVALRCLKRRPYGMGHRMQPYASSRGMGRRCFYCGRIDLDLGGAL